MALDELESARTSVDAATLGLQLANDEVAQAERRFQAGVTTNIEIVTAQDELARASNNRINALYVLIGPGLVSREPSVKSNQLTPGEYSSWPITRHNQRQE